MANIVIHQIGVPYPAGYLTLDEWWYQEGIDSLTGNLVENDIVKIASLTPGLIEYRTTTLSMITGVQHAEYIDDKHYFIIRADPGVEFKGDFNDVTVPRIMKYDRGLIIDCNIPYTRFENFIITGPTDNPDAIDGDVFGGAIDYNPLVTPHFQLEQPGNTAIRMYDSIADGLGIYRIYAQGIIAQGMHKAVGIDSRGNSIVRNCVVQDIMSRVSNVNIEFTNLHTAAYGIVGEKSCKILNNTVSNIFAQNIRATGLVNNISKAYGIYLTEQFTGSIITWPDGFSFEDCIQDSGGCGTSTNFNWHGVSYNPFSTGNRLFNAACSLRVIISGANDNTGAGIPCSSYNGIYETTIRSNRTLGDYGEWAVPLGTTAIQPGNTGTYGELVVYLQSSPPTLNVGYFSGSHLLVGLWSTSVSFPLDCKNLNITASWTTGYIACTAAPYAGNSVAIVESLHPDEVGGSGVQIIPGALASGYVYNNLSMLTSASGQGVRV